LRWLGIFEFTGAEVDDSNYEKDEGEDGANEGADDIGGLAFDLRDGDLFGVSDDSIEHPPTKYN